MTHTAPTDEYYAQKARDAAALQPYRLCFKDVGGMLTPERTRTLVRLINKFPNPPNKDVGEGLDTAFEAMKHAYGRWSAG